MKILITGSTGFLGKFLCQYLSNKDYSVIAHTRTPQVFSQSNIENINFDLNQNLEELDLDGVQVVIHCAGRAHVMNETAASPLNAYRQINVKGTLNLAKKAVQSGVRRFIYLSSIKVNGEEATQQKPFTAEDSINTDDPYGLSKYEAEQALKQLAQETGLEVVIIRPVLIYGPNVKANFKSMISLASKKIPLPVGCLNNKRSMVSVYNLADLIEVCLSHPNAPRQTFLASDQDDISVKQLFEKLASLQNNKLIKLPIPKSLIFLLASLVGRSAMASRLCSELVVDTSKNTQVLGWKAPYSTEQSLAKMFREMG
ncbi:TPA: NAD-dependent epimerase/dehydratase family protein [Acinetobacter baumannii]|uniref:NAD-dependent epimerase/dehydratase family protein n=1 Tax=Acinetobacter baumannii TaxID=470 RepID=UPI001E0EFE8D|nr:NAD-dependent epimerase/dehydratase family protein [Acinetobacter baumannii]EHU3217363.1 NAD-dependent epimerase/dehydratase family protein [Acinetobacter baumannii]MDC4299904.1 NAD-dependent epimerase/dehydratase family protein [Acinetobacter baumannii]MDC4753519.1 NAD-dependent epimerase/dehydratase family protein [Acinetobacter baumannii]MDC4829352.1 NAD-dependent epimerase/dehydratase family protein [Acinetobacter baumannii]MDC5369444.1 NAD-dependent epimerase/dehydratase family protein